MDEAAFQKWYADWAGKSGMNPNPDDPSHFYDYRGAYQAGVVPPVPGGHWPSTFKIEGHPRMIMDGVNTKTGQRVNPALQDAWNNAPTLMPESSSNMYDSLMQNMFQGGNVGQLLGGSRPVMMAGAPAGYFNPQQRIADIEGAVGQEPQVTPQQQSQPQEAQPVRSQKAPITKQLGDGSWVQWDDYNQVWVPMRGI